MSSRDPIVRNAVSIGVATGVYAVSFGVLSVAAGFSVVQTCVMSLVCFTGASQLTFASVIGAGGGVAGALPPALLLAGRNALYALSLKGVLTGTVPKRALRAQGVIDETTAMAHAQTTLAAKRRAFDLTAVLPVHGVEHRDAGRRARRSRPRQPSRLRSRRGVPGGVPRAAGAAAPRGRTRSARRWRAR